MNTERNCQSCGHYKDGYCKNLELKPCYPQKGCDDFIKRNESKTEVLDKIRAEIVKVSNQEKFHDEKWALGLKYAVSIIDKYAESEGKE